MSLHITLCLCLWLVCLYVCYSLSHPSADMALVESGQFRMGTDAPVFPWDGEGPARILFVPAFYLDRHEVRNAEFAAFVAATGHRTDAERLGDSFVMYNLLSERVNSEINQSVAGAPWWLKVPGASWHSPEGPGSGVGLRPGHPVTHVSWRDASAYCEWRQKRLPSEREWERAARGGLGDRLYPWGNKAMPQGRHYANVWQGEFPHRNSGEDGYVGAAPVGEFPPNKFGLFDMAGNVWEWVQDDWHIPKGDTLDTKDTIYTMDTGDKVMKGGSFACHRDYCYRYRCAARSKNTADSSAVHIGFRCARDL